MLPLLTLILSTAAIVLATLPTQLSGKLLLTSVISPTLNILDPASTNATLVEVHTFPNCTGLAGIIEYAPDVYAVVASTLDTTTRRAVPESNVIWGIDFTADPAAVKRIAGIPDGTLNGLSTVPGAPALILVADSALGAAYQINVHTGAVRTAVQDAALAPDAPTVALGINGLHVRAGELYFTNSALQTFARVSISVDAVGVHQAGAVQVLGTVQSTQPASVAFFDDFALDSTGRAWVATHPGSLTLSFQFANGTWAQETVAGDPDASNAVFMDPTATAFGRRKGEDKMLYVVTLGGQIVRVNTVSV
ncbi:hypothetical protein FB451DRAFT_1241930 [Mycena latifolia]|nr:hypothetical protein FB451DRAFT_1241930 [Mycena latifolia]